MQLRMSPTAGMPSSSRSAPDEPPSSATVTIAVRLAVCSFRPRRSAERPVPPPIATIRGPAGQQALPIKDLAQRDFLVDGSQGLRDRPQEPHAADRHQADAHDADDQPAQRVRKELECHGVEDGARQSGRVHFRGRLADDMGDGEGQEQQPERRRRPASA